MPINYELAKQLKDAGFPQEGFGMRWNGNVWTTQDIEGLYQPTLLELIEACKSGFINLERLPHLFWVTNIGKITGDDMDTYQTDGKTPEEAVANLWLVINKKYDRQSL